MILLGPKARIGGARPELVLGLLVAAGVYEDHGRALIVLHVVDGRHMRGSLHYVGAAADLGLIQGGDNEALRQDLHAALGAEWDVVLEPGHIHIEWQPKTGVNL